MCLFNATYGIYEDFSKTKSRYREATISYYLQAYTLYTHSYTHTHTYNYKHNGCYKIAYSAMRIK